MFPSPSRASFRRTGSGAFDVDVDFQEHLPVGRIIACPRRSPRARRPSRLLVTGLVDGGTVGSLGPGDRLRHASAPAERVASACTKWRSKPPLLLLLLLLLLPFDARASGCACARSRSVSAYDGRTQAVQKKLVLLL